MNQSKIEQALIYLLPTVQDFVFIVIFISVIFLGPRMMNIDGDLGRHLTIGRYILENHQIPTEDIFSHTKPGEALTPHEWLSQLVFAGFDQVFGLGGVVLVCAIVLALAYSLIYRLFIRAGGGIIGALIYTFAAAAASSLHWLTRPHIFTILFLILWISVLEEMRRGRLNYWWYLPLIMLFWVNFHGAFIAGFASLVFYVVGIGWDWAVHKDDPFFVEPKAVRFWLLGAGAALLTTLANPVGLKIWETSIGFLQNQYLVSHTAEYLSPNFQDKSTWPFLFLLVSAILLLGLFRTRIPGAQIFLLTGWAAMALYSTRNIPLFTIAAAPVYAILLKEFISQSFISPLQRLNDSLENTNQRLRGNLIPVILVLLTAAGFLLLPGRLTSRFEFSPKVFPVAAVDWLAENPQSGDVFNYFPWGGYLLYRLWPTEQVFIDGQTDFYGEDLTREYESVLTLGNDWEGILRKYAVGWVIMPAGSNLTEALEATGHWERIYQDDTTEILKNG